MKPANKEILTLPCIRNRCDWVAHAVFIDNPPRKFKLEYIKRTLQTLVKNHEDGKHAVPQVKEDV